MEKKTIDAATELGTYLRARGDFKREREKSEEVSAGRELRTGGTLVARACFSCAIPVMSAADGIDRGILGKVCAAESRCEGCAGLDSRPRIG